jgi:hypothetical protein
MRAARNESENRAEISNARCVRRLISVDRCKVRPKLIQRRIERMRLQIGESGITAKSLGERQKSWMLDFVLLYDGSARLALQKPEQGKQFREHGNGPPSGPRRTGQRLAMKSLSSVSRDIPSHSRSLAANLTLPTLLITIAMQQSGQGSSVVHSV